MTRAVIIHKTYQADRAGIEQSCQEFDVQADHEFIHSLMISLFVWGTSEHEGIEWTINCREDTGLSNGTFTVRRS